MLQLTDDNYYSLEADNNYMSCSLYQKFIECEAKACAHLRGEWKDKKTTALLMGNYVHSHFESPEAKKKFLATNPEMFKKDLTLKSDYVDADEMIATLEADEYCMYMLQGDSEVIVTAELFGLPWKVKFDKYRPEKRRIVDIKTTKSIREHDWMVKDGQNIKANFLEVRDYLMRAAVYCEVERIASGREPGDWLDFYIVAVSKEDPPDKAVISLIDPYRYAEELAKIEANMTRIKLLKSGSLQPVRCEKCDYCRSTKKVEKALHYSEL